MVKWWLQTDEWKFDEMVEWRRHLHMHPEVSYEEERTARFIAEKLEQFGIPVTRNVGGHGVVGVIRSTLGEGPTVALRADFDALAIQDEKTCEYRSTVPGVMHACGHDGHTAGLLGAARMLMNNRDKWRGEIRLLFQPAEEISPGGAQAMIREHALEGVQAVYGIHLWTPIQTGTIATRPGPIMASVDDFFLTIYGKGGHGGMPHVCTDAVIIGASLVQQFQTIVSRNVSPLDSAVVSIGTLQAGSTQNVIADRAIIKGTVRAFQPHVRTLLQERIEQMIKHTCAMYNAEYELEYRIGYPTLVNDELEAERMMKAATESFGSHAIEESEMIMPAEDFAYYAEKLPACFAFVGAGNDQQAKYPHHHPMFDIDEHAMLQAGQLLIATAMDALVHLNVPVSK
ncbi:amidohydrolase [Paenibacillus marinisediminis]